MGVWEVSPILVNFNGHEIRYYSLFFSSMMIIAYYVFRWQMNLGGYSNRMTDFFLLSLAVIIGSRLGHVVFYEPGYFFSHPAEIFNLDRGGLASHGATIALFLALCWIASRESARLIDILDRFTISATIAIIFVRLGNFFNSEIVGRITIMPWGLKFPLSTMDKHLPMEQMPYRHPVQLYEAGIGLLVMIFLLYINKRFAKQRPPGLMVAVLFIGYFGGRFFIEFFKEYQVFNRDDSLLTMGQYLSLPLVAIGLLLLKRSMSQLKATH